VKKGEGSRKRGRDTGLDTVRYTWVTYRRTQLT
jgi:hypothetical protein